VSAEGIEPSTKGLKGQIPKTAFPIQKLAKFTQSVEEVLGRLPELNLKI
jgi:hypothetical protein